MQLHSNKKRPERNSEQHIIIEPGWTLEEKEIAILAFLRLPRG